MIAVGDVLRFVSKLILGTSSEVNWVWHYLVTSGTTETDLNVVTALRDDLQLALAGMVANAHTSLASTECELYVWDSVLNRFDGTAQVNWTSFTGTDGLHALSNQNAALVKFFTNVGRRQARKYFSGYTEGKVDGNALTGTLTAALLAWSAILDDPLTIGSVVVTPCVFNVDPASPLFETTELFNAVTAVETVPATMRSRKVGVGI
jgi:hypothetical protein